MIYVCRIDGSTDMRLFPDSSHLGNDKSVTRIAMDAPTVTAIPAFVFAETNIDLRDALSRRSAKERQLATDVMHVGEFEIAVTHPEVPKGSDVVALISLSERWAFPVPRDENLEGIAPAVQYVRRHSAAIVDELRRAFGAAMLVL